MIICRFLRNGAVMPENEKTQPNDTKLETADTKVRRALEAEPGATAAKLASAAGVGRSTATKILSRWAAEGLVTRTTGKDQSVPVTWTLRDEQIDDAVDAATDSEDVAPTAEQESDTPAGDTDYREADSSPSPATGTSTASDPTPSGDPTAYAPKKERLPKGGLYELVKEFLQTHPGEEYGPAKIG